MLVCCLPGLGQVLTSEAAKLPGTVEASFAGCDGRNDWVAFKTTEPANVMQLRCAEDAFAQVALVGNGDLRQISGRLTDPTKLQLAENLYFIVLGRRLKQRATARVVARVADETHFKRTDLRFEAGQALSAARPEWRYGDPADAELWISQLAGRKYISALRITDAAFRQHGGRSQERMGALRPSVAAAMIRLAGSPNNKPLVDITCGSGTLLLEAGEAGWRAVGSDIDAEAVAAARYNVRNASTCVSDARSLPFAAHSVGAVVSNLPFGSQFSVQGDAQLWYQDVLEELKRVQKVGAPTVLLLPKSPEFNKALDYTGFAAKRSLDILLLGVKTRIWKLERVD